jgi:hypothetical protein
MKKAIFGTFGMMTILAASSAQASTLSCRTSAMQNNDFYAVRVDAQSGSTAGTAAVTSGGNTMMPTAFPEIAVTISNYGPQGSTFANQEQGFELTVIFQDFGQVQNYGGNLIAEIYGQRVVQPVVCTVSN